MSGELARALTLHQAGKLSEAEQLYRSVLAHDATNAEALHLLGVVQHQHGKHAEAVQLIESAIALSPRNAEYYSNLGEALRAQDLLDAAERAFKHAIQLTPTFAIPHNNLGVMHQSQRRWAEAEQCFREAVRLDGGYRIARFNQANVLRSLGRTAEAVAIYEELIARHPTWIDPYLNLSDVQLRHARPEAAAVTLRAALQVDPQNPAVLINLGNAAKDEGLLDDAIACYRRASAVQPTHKTAASNLLYLLHFHPDLTPVQIREEHRKWEQSFIAPVQRPPRQPRPTGARIRIGYSSPNFCDHVVGWNMLPLFEHHDRAAFDIVCYSDVVRPDALTQKFRSHANTWRDCGEKNSEQMAAMVERDQLDIFVDLTLHMAGNRLRVFARKPAQIQATFAGYPGSTGLSAIDFRLTDSHLEPADSAAGVEWPETPIRLKSFWCYQPRGDEPAVSPLPAGTQGGITFGCLNNFTKVNDRVVSWWSRILQQVPGSRIILLAPPGAGRNRIVRAMVQAGVAPERLHFVAQLSHADYMLLYGKIDIVLDTFPYNGHTTSCDALWMGVPVVTLRGDTVVSRAGVSQLTNTGLTELIASSVDEYISIACALAVDRPRLEQLRHSMRERMLRSPLMDARGFARGIEDAYRQMIERMAAHTPSPATPG